MCWAPPLLLLLLLLLGRPPRESQGGVAPQTSRQRHRLLLPLLLPLLPLLPLPLPPLLLGQASPESIGCDHAR